MLLLLLAATALAAAPPAGGAVERAAEALVAQAMEGAAPARVAVAVAAPGHEGLRAPVAAALSQALGRLGHAALPLGGVPPGGLEASARATGADLLLQVTAALARGELALAGELTSTRPNFFLQREPAVPPGGGRFVTLSVPADAAARALAGAARRPAGTVSVFPLAELPEPVLALAAGPTRQDGAVRLVAVTAAAVLLLDARGALLDARPLPPPPPGPRVRDLAATVAVGSFAGGGRIGYAVAGRVGGEVLSAEDDRLEHAADLPAAPLACGGAGLLFGRFAAGSGLLEDALAAAADGVPPAASAGRRLLGVAAAPRPGRVAFAALGDDYRLRLLGPALEDRGAVPGVGAGFALADLDGDGEPEVVASGVRPGEDAVRALRPGAAPLLAPAPVPGAVRAGAAADLTGDGLDDAVLASWMTGGGSRLWLVTADPGTAP